MLYQYVGAQGNCAVVSSSAFLDAFGEQEQFVGSSVSMKAQEQSLGVAAQQLLFRSDGAGSGSATHTADLGQNQMGHNSAGTVTETSGINLSQTSSVTGVPTSTAQVVNSAQVMTSQAQQVFYQPPMP